MALKRAAQNKRAALNKRAHRLRPSAIRRRTLAIAATFMLPAGMLPAGILLTAMLLSGCTQKPTPPPVPPRAAIPVKPPDWYHQQLTAARAAKRAHQPASDTAGAQQAYDEVMRTACLHAAVMGAGKYPARCDAVLRQQPAQTLTDPCEASADDPAMQTDCSD